MQVIPHITNRIKEFIKNDISKEDFVICNRGTVGDIESLPLEAIRQFSNEFEGIILYLFILHLSHICEHLMK